MRTSLKVTVLLGVLAVAAMYAWIGGREVLAGSPPDRPVFVLNLTSGKEDLHAVWMGLQLAEHALNDGREVVLFLNVHAAELAARQTSDKLAFQEKPPVQKLLKGLTSRGAHLLVCPACLEVLGIEADALIEGAQLASREGLFGRLGADAVVFSY
jgi:predicted peroxiredoxin